MPFIHRINGCNTFPPPRWWSALTLGKRSMSRKRPIFGASSSRDGPGPSPQYACRLRELTGLYPAGAAGPWPGPRHRGDGIDRALHLEPRPVAARPRHRGCQRQSGHHQTEQESCNEVSGAFFGGYFHTVLQSGTHLERTVMAIISQRLRPRMRSDSIDVSCNSSPDQ